MTEPLVYSVRELQTVLSVGRRRAYEIAREIGVRVSPRRIVVSKARVEEFLGNGNARDLTVRVGPVNEDRIPFEILLIGIARAAARGITEDPAFTDREKTCALGDLRQQIPDGLARVGVAWETEHWRSGLPPSLDQLGL